MAKGNANKARVVAVMGATGTGKSTWVFKQIEKEKRLAIWSPKEAIDNYAGRLGAHVCHTADEFLNLMIAAKSGQVRVVMIPPKGRENAEKLFDVFCSIAMTAKNTCVLVEELHTVVRSGYAPDGWANLILMGRGYGSKVYGVSQRPAKVDKDFWGNCSTVFSGRLNFPDDAKVLANSLMVDYRELINLPDLAYIERSPPKPAIRGTMKI